MQSRLLKNKRVSMGRRALLMPANGAPEQQNMLEDLVTRGIKGIAVSPIDAANQVNLLNGIAERLRLAVTEAEASF